MNEEKNPRTVFAVQSGDSSFIMAKHPLGYLLFFGSRLSSHLLLRCLTTPAIAVTIIDMVYRGSGGNVRMMEG